MEYFRIIQDVINLSQNNVNAIISENTKKNILNIIHIIKKFLVNICFTCLILSCSFLAFISENIGKRSQNIGVIIKKGIPIRLK
jgi:hypothetical protein